MAFGQWNSDGRGAMSNAVSSKNGRWALLIGIDYYDRFGRGNLKGCVRDAIQMKQILQNELNVPASNITELLGRVPDGDLSSWNYPAAPTRQDIVAAIQKLTRDVPPGDFVYIHFSGHGTQVPTVYDKPYPKDDEALLCADGTIIRDVELSILLEDLSKERDVLTLLDCCHSGGALRGDETGDANVTVRSWTNAIESDPKDTEWIGIECFNDLVTKVSESKDSHWFYKSRPFNLIAACQPDEKACECPDEDNEVRGLLSSALAQSIGILGPSVFSVNYRTLMDILQVQCRAAFRGNFQTPVMFGEVTKGLFALVKGTWDQMDGAAFSIAEGPRGDRYELNRGLSDGVRIGDRYQLTHPRGNIEPFRVKVIAIYDFMAEAATSRRKSPRGDDVWFARRVSRAAPTLVPVDCSTGSTESIESLRKNWKQCVDRENPLEFHFDEKIDAKYSVRVDDGSYTIWLGNREPLPNPIPSLPATAELRTVKKLCSMLVHIQRFLEFDQLRPLTEWETRHELKVEEVDTQVRPFVLKELRLDYRNGSPEQVWITIMNLQPDWSVSLVIPRLGQPGQPVRKGEPINQIKGTLSVPECLRSNYGLELRDKFKMIVSNQPHDFSHYELPSLYDSKLPVHRNFKRDVPGGWDICERIVTWKVPEKIVPVTDSCP